jgi:pimeloyl-ACP methyl ester carboxylesterase
VGTIVEDVQGYALYLPSTYKADRAWPVIFAFDPRARGRTAVERYQAAAEKYGYIVAGSNVSRNGSWEVSMKAAESMAADVSRRFQIDPKRVYAAGMSGGARVAMALALGSDIFAGVIASSAGYPDSKPRKMLPFVVFGTAGTEDFNYPEMRDLDRTLGSPHRVAIFEGGHVWLSSELAIEAVEWIELQAMASGRAPRNNEWIDRTYTARLAAAEGLAGASAVRALEAIAADFREFKDVAAISARAAALRKDRGVKDVFKSEQAEVRAEQKRIADILALERQLADRDTRPVAFSQLRDEWKHLRAEAAAESDSSKRRVARRITRGLAMGARERTSDSDYLKILGPAFPPREPTAPSPARPE